MSFSNIYVNMYAQLSNLHLLYFIDKKGKRNLFITTNNRHKSGFPYFDLFMFPEEIGIMINMEYRK